MWAKEKSYNFTLINRSIFIFIILFFYSSYAYANFQAKLIDKYKKINTLHFDFTQKIGEKIETGNCFIKYPLFMKCEYPKKKKIIIANGKKISIIKKRYKKIYNYPLKKTPLFYLLQKEVILEMINNHQPSKIDKNIIEYEFVEKDLKKLNIFFDKNSLELSGWKTTDPYSNNVIFLIKNLKTNILIKDEIFKIPKEEDL
tara:strand:+ start:2196 stop:2795 length:600 start_codon:yes stop_codon:yes gene_type:complete